MAATAAQVAQLRRLIDESGTGTYSDGLLEEYIAKYPLVDSSGYESDSDSWTATYDLYAAAADILFEKAAAVADEFDFDADGATFNMSQKHRSYLAQAERMLGLSAQQVRHHVV